MHSPGGYHGGAALDDAWAMAIDLASVGLLLWVVSGICMWWHLPKVRS